MDALFEIGDRDVLQSWIAGRGRRRRVAVPPAVVVPGVRFAFYGRTSTAEFQDPVTSRAWQREVAATLVAGHGTITTEFFDVGVSRRVSWERRPQAAALLERAQNPDRLFDAVVVGEFERAFTDRQVEQVARLLQRDGVLVWLPEAGGPVDLDAPTHRMLMQVLAAQSQREVVRSRHRTMAAMTAQTIEQGRFLGGRPPYGYRLVDAGPHPNQAHAGWGRRCHRLAPDPVTAPQVQWMFAERLAGRSVAGIARELNERGVPCPSAADPERNRHRGGQRWILRSVVVILANPRYTGRQVWSRQRGVPGAGRSTVVGEWAVSRAVSHPALVSEADFIAVQQRRAARRCEDGARRDYVLAGLVQCRLCGRRMDSHWVNGRAGYRCRHGHPSAQTRPSDAARNIYVREDVLLDQLARHLASDRHRPGGDVEPSTAEEVVARLRAESKMIVCGRADWALAPAGRTLPIGPTIAPAQVGMG
jgi:DNA invertase Pin-like site-specific DNA recombinase